MHFLVTAFDGKDAGAGLRRSEARERHLENIMRLKKEGTHLFGAALLDDCGNMTGSLLIVDYPSQQILRQEWLDSEPYVVDKVWETVNIEPCKVPAFFMEPNA